MTDSNGRGNRGEFTGFATDAGHPEGTVLGLSKLRNGRRAKKLFPVML